MTILLKFIGKFASVRIPGNLQNFEGDELSTLEKDEDTILCDRSGAPGDNITSTDDVSGGSSTTATPTTSSNNDSATGSMIKKLRLRGDWSDTGPLARPERLVTADPAGGAPLQPAGGESRDHVVYICCLRLYLLTLFTILLIFF